MPSPVVVVIDDEPLILASVETVLGDAGFDVRAFDNSPEAIGYIEDLSTKVAALVTDIRLGAEAPSGWAIARSARELVPRLAIVYMSGDGAIDWHSQGVPRSAYLQKPFTSAQMVAAVSLALRGELERTALPDDGGNALPRLCASKGRDKMPSALMQDP